MSEASTTCARRQTVHRKPNHSQWREAAFATACAAAFLIAIPVFAGNAPLTAVASLATAPSPRADNERTLSFEDRVRYQRRIEEVYWRHRIWPQENPGPKPPLEAVIPESRIRAKVEDYVKKSNALEVLWGRPITDTQLQAEMDRMVRQSHAPGILRELFDGLGNDPFVIAETLVRQTLADRLIHTWYAGDERFHGDLRRQAELTLEGVSSGLQLRSLDTEYSETTWKQEDENAERWEPKPDAFTLDAKAWREHMDRLTALFGLRRKACSTTPIEPGSQAALVETIPLMTVSSLQEDDARFFVISVVNREADAITVATASWAKTAFDTWWAEQSVGQSSVLEPAHGDFVLTELGVENRCVPDTWSALPVGAEPTSPSARYNHAAVWTGSEMIVCGGVSDQGTLRADGGRYDPSTDSWILIAGGPCALNRPTAVWTGSEMIVWGGTTATGDTPPSYPADGGRYNPTSDTWGGTTTDGAPSGRVYNTAVWTGAEMIIWGGSGDGTEYDTGGRYNPSTDRWVATTTTGAPSARYGHTAVWNGSEMIVWGGYRDAPFYQHYNTGGRYDPQRNRWNATTTTDAPSARQFHSAVWTGNEMIVWGGWDSSSRLSTGGRYDPSRDAWSAMPTAGAPAGRIFHTAVWTGHEMIVWGGCDDYYTCFNSGGRYDPDNDSWTPTNTGEAPSARRDHTAVWTGSEMIVWGGQKQFIDTDTGARYDPSSDSWVPTARFLGAPAPSPRYGHTAVWTGSEMIVWGGWDNFFTFFKTGGRYNPATNSWMTTSTTGAGSARANPTAVWTGKEMIIWGGWSYTGGPMPPSSLGGGGRYNPATDTWASMSAENWGGADGNTAVWTGREMIVWGGMARGVDDIYLGGGGAYDPSTDTWRLTTTQGAPTARANHTAVWTGHEMIVWGGEFVGDGSWVYEDTGGRYDPSTDRWLTTSTAGAPVPSAGHTAVWTGSEMIVNAFQNTGGRYDPSTDSWTTMSTIGAHHIGTAVWTDSEMIVWDGSGARYNPFTDRWSEMSMTGAPSPRTNHTAVWTGDEMIVWGGNQYGWAVDSGGRYCARECGDGEVDPGEDCDDGNDNNADGCDIDCHFVAQITCNSPTPPGDAQSCMADVPCSEIASCTDPEGGPVSIVCSPGSPYVAGMTDVTVECTDSHGTTGTVCTAGVTVLDVTPPGISIDPVPSMLWPPNHHMVQIDAGVSASDNCAAPTITLVSVTSDEPDNGDGDGDTVDDIRAETGTSATSLALRAEREGEGEGRVYTITYTATDAGGNQSEATATVVVPHDLGGMTDPLQLQIVETPDGTRVIWTPVPAALYYNVVRTRLNDLREDVSSYNLGVATCIKGESLTPDTYKHEDPQDPPPGGVFIYVVEYFDGLTRSSYGTVSASKPRVVDSGDCE